MELNGHELILDPLFTFIGRLFTPLNKFVKVSRDFHVSFDQFINLPPLVWK